MGSVRLKRSARIIVLAAVGLAPIGTSFATGSQTSRPFAGVKANTGTVTHTKENGQSVLTLSDDFKVPDTPDPHWQVVDSKGKTYLLQRLPVKGDKVNRRIIVPAYVANVQIWCAFAETLLGEAEFASPVKE